MADRTSRRRLANYVAEQLAAGNTTVLEELAAYLVDNGRTKEADVLVRDIESALAMRGTVIVDASTARALSADMQQAIESFVDSHYPKSQLVMRSHIDPSLIGGVKLELAGQELDATIRHKLTTLKASKIG